jgi:hypothetical protein
MKEFDIMSLVKTPKFALQLYQIISDPANKSIINWEGQGFEIYDIKAF